MGLQKMTERHTFGGSPVQSGEEHITMSTIIVDRDLTCGKFNFLFLAMIIR